MTAQLEQGQRDELHREMMRLPRGDERRVAWLAVDRLSSQWVSSHPTHRVELNAAETLSSARPSPPTLHGVREPYRAAVHWALDPVRRAA